MIRVVLLFALLLIPPLPSSSFATLAAAESETTHLIGAPVFVRDGVEVGTVSGYRGGDADDDVLEIHVTSAGTIGIEKTTVIIARASVILLRGAVALDMTLDEAVALFKAVGAA